MRTRPARRRRRCSRRLLRLGLGLRVGRGFERAWRRLAVDLVRVFEGLADVAARIVYAQLAIA